MANKEQSSDKSSVISHLPTVLHYSNACMKLNTIPHAVRHHAKTDE